MIWIVLLISLISIYGVLVCLVLPKLIFKMKLDTYIPKGIGQKIVKESFGTSVLYLADKSMNKYLHQYILSNRNNKTVLICEIDTNIYFIDYDCLCYDDKKNLIKIIKVSENVASRGLTEELLLPKETVEVALVLNQANENVFKKSYNTHLSLGSIFTFSAIELVLTLVLLLFAKIFLANLAADVLVESYISEPIGILMYAMIIVFVLASVFIIYGSHKIKHVYKGAK